MYRYDAAVLIGRFQPFHLAHLTLLQHAFTLADHVVVGLGSAQLDRSLKNPWLPVERAEMIGGAVPLERRYRLRFVQLHDFGNMKKWCDHVREEVERAVGPEKRICLTTVRKDASTEYVDYLGWAFEKGPACPALAATDIRDNYFGGVSEKWREYVPASTAAVLDSFRKSETYLRLRTEWLDPVRGPR